VFGFTPFYGKALKADAARSGNISADRLQNVKTCGAHFT
jgi:hypothetical protein